MSDPIEIKLASGLNWVLYEKNNEITTDREIKPETQLYIIKENKFTSIGTLKEVKKASGFGTLDIKTKDKEKIGEIDLMTGIINTTLYAEPPGNTGGKRNPARNSKAYGRGKAHPKTGGKKKTRKYKRKTKRRYYVFE